MTLAVAVRVPPERTAVPIVEPWPDRLTIGYRATRGSRIAGMLMCAARREPHPTVKKFCEQGAFFVERGTRQAIIIDRIAWRSTNRSPCGCATPHEPRVGLAGMGGGVAASAFTAGSSAEDSEAERATAVEGRGRSPSFIDISGRGEAGIPRRSL
jgi:hypothetical protein